jgi:hypothetical protein
MDGPCEEQRVNEVGETDVQAELYARSWMYPVRLGGALIRRLLTSCRSTGQHTLELSCFPWTPPCFSF